MLAAALTVLWDSVQCIPRAADRVSLVEGMVHLVIYSEYMLVDGGMETSLISYCGSLTAVLSVITWGVKRWVQVFCRVVIHFNNIHPLQYMAQKKWTVFYQPLQIFFLQFFAVGSTHDKLWNCVKVMMCVLKAVGSKDMTWSICGRESTVGYKLGCHR